MSEIRNPEWNDDISLKSVSPEQLRQREKDVRDIDAEINNLSLDKDFEVSKPKDIKTEGNSDSKKHLDENDLAIEKLDSNNNPIEGIAKARNLQGYI